MSFDFTSMGELNPQAIAPLTEAEAWFDSYWWPYIGEIQKGGQNPTGVSSKGMRPQEMPLVKYSQFAPSNTDTVYVPQLQHLIGTGVYGDLDLEGSEEDMDIFNHELKINALAHAVNTRTGPMNTLRAKQVAMMQAARPLLRQWFSNKMSWEITQAFYKGISPNIAATAITGGLAGTQRDHPNIFVPGIVGTANVTDGWVDYDPTAATYMARVAVAINAQNNALTDARKFSADLLDVLRPALTRKRLKPAFMQRGKKRWIILLNGDTMAQANADERIRTASDAAFSGKGFEHPMIEGSELYYNGFVLVENESVGLEVHQTADTTTIYGAVNAAETAHLNPLDNIVSTDSADRVIKASLILGGNAMSIGRVNTLEMVPKNGAYNDYKRKESVGGTLIFGAARAEWTTSLATRTEINNFGSALIFTNSPANAL